MIVDERDHDLRRRSSFSTGVIQGVGDGIDLTAGGSVTNGASGSTAAVIEGGNNGVLMTGSSTTVVNFGTIMATGAASSSFGLDLSSDDTLNNYGYINGRTAVYIGGTAGSRIVNDGTILGDAFHGVYANVLASVTNFGTGVIHGVGDGIDLTAGGSVTNGASGSTAAVIEGGNNGVLMTGSSATVVNFGTIMATGAASSSFGLFLYSDDTLNNYGYINGRTAVYIGGTAGSRVVNDGTIVGDAFHGVYANVLASVTNLGTGVIEGAVGIQATGAAGITVVNYGTIDGTGGTAVSFSAASSLLMLEGGSALLGAAVGAGGTIEFVGAGTLTSTLYGFSRANIDAAANWTLSGSDTIASGGTFGVVGTLVNEGTLVTTGAAGTGIVLSGGGRVTNGGSGSAAALIEGAVGVQATDTAGVTVVNYGTIDGTGGTAVSFSAASSLLMLEGGSALVGKVTGGGGTLDLAGGNGAGTLSGLGSVGGPYSGFAQYAVLAGADWTLTGSNTIASGDTLTDQGTLHVSGSLDNAGTFQVSGSLDNAGVIVGAGGAAGSLFVAAGAGGAGGAGVSGGATAYAFIGNSGTITGGSGGAGGSSASGSGGAGGTGGVGISLGADGGSIGNTGTIAGGGGGAGGFSSSVGGTGGAGAAGVMLSGKGSVDNLGTIAGGVGDAGSGAAAAAGNGIVLALGGVVTNGDSTHTAARIEGGTGIQATGAAGATVINYGTITGIAGAGNRPCERRGLCQQSRDERDRAHQWHKLRRSIQFERCSH